MVSVGLHGLAYGAFRVSERDAERAFGFCASLFL